MILGLANRRRIWNVCSQLVDQHLEKMRLPSTEELMGDDAEEIIQHSFSIGMLLVRCPASKAITSLTTYFISSWRTMYHKDKQITVHFNDCGYLCGVSLLVNSEREASSFWPRVGYGTWWQAIRPAYI